MNFNSNRYVYIRKTVFVLLIILTALFQHTGFIPRLFGAPAMLLVPLTVCLCMFERSTSGMWYGVLAGALWDFASVRGDGFFAVVLTVIAFISGTLITFVFRRSIRSALVISFGALAFTNVSYWLIFILRKGYEDAFSVLISYYMPSVFYSMIFVFVYYYLAEAIVKLTAQKRKF